MNRFHRYKDREDKKMSEYYSDSKSIKEMNESEDDSHRFKSNRFRNKPKFNNEQEV